TIAAVTIGHPASRHPDSSGHRHVAGRAAPALAAYDGNRDRILNAFADLPVAFVENRGQTDKRVRYYAAGSRHAFYLARDQIVLSFMRSAKEKGVALALRFLQSNPQVVLDGEQRAPGTVNYFRGNDPAR